jgi:CheY-like chemotaxis protein
MRHERLQERFHPWAERARWLGTTETHDLHRLHPQAHSFRISDTERRLGGGAFLALPRCEMEPIRVLVVDDERNARTALAELLRDEGYEVEEAADGAEALERTAAFRPHVVLSDVKMPRMTGIQLRSRLVAGGPVPVVVLMSASPCVDGGLFMSKPIRVADLYQTMATAGARAHAA